MPLYDFRCAACGERFEELAGPDERPACPACRAPGAERLLSPFSPPRRFGLWGRAARESDARRAEREARRRERFAEQRRRRSA